MGEGTVLEADSFLIKGEETAPFTRWGANPATELRPVVSAPMVANTVVPADSHSQALAA